MTDDTTIKNPAAGATDGDKIATDELATLNGQATVDPKPKAQRVKILHGDDGDGTDSSAASPFPTADYSPPLVQLAPGGGDVPEGVAVFALPATPGRVKATVQHCGTTGKLWVRFDGSDAAPGIGEFAGPGEQWVEWTDATVSVYFEDDTATTVRVATSEIGA